MPSLNAEQILYVLVRNQVRIAELEEENEALVQAKSGEAAKAMAFEAQLVKLREETAAKTAPDEAKTPVLDDKREEEISRALNEGITETRAEPPPQSPPADLVVGAVAKEDMPF